MLNYKKLCATLCLAVLVTSCSKQQTLTGSTDTLQGLKNMAFSTRAIGNKNMNQSNLRIQALRDTALTIGAQSGLAYHAKHINTELMQQQKLLNKIYNFNALLLEKSVLPPVLTEGRQTLNLANSHSIRISDRTFKILKQARFVTTPPTWRQYLWMDYKLPDRPDITLLPKGADEQHAWQQYVAQGWNSGLQQAQIIFSNNIARLKQDYTGMILYRKLLAQNMVSPPYVSQTDLGVTGDENQIHIDDKVLRITALPALNPNSHAWKSAVSKNNNQLRHYRGLEKLAKNTPIRITNQAWQDIIPTVH